MDRLKTLIFFSHWPRYINTHPHANTYNHFTALLDFVWDYIS